MIIHFPKFVVSVVPYKCFPEMYTGFSVKICGKQLVCGVNFNIQTFLKIIVKPEVHIVSWVTFQNSTRKLHLCGLTDNLDENTKLIKAVRTQILYTAEIQT